MPESARCASKSTCRRAGPGTIIPPSRRAHGAAYATYVGSWRTRFRITQGKTSLSRYEDAATKMARSFSANCGTPVIYERARSPHMVNIRRALFSGRTGRQPLYHIAIEELQEWFHNRRAAGAAERLSRRRLAALEKEEARRSGRDVLKRAPHFTSDHDR